MNAARIRVILFLLLPLVGFCTTGVENRYEVHRYACFEIEFTSSATYENPVQGVEVKVTFKAPSGKERTVLAFSDGGLIWKTPFSPDELGKWTYLSNSSDPNNVGLTAQRGGFRCEASRLSHPFYNHGELKL